MSSVISTATLSFLSIICYNVYYNIIKWLGMLYQRIRDRNWYPIASTIP